MEGDAGSRLGQPFDGIERDISFRAAGEGGLLVDWVTDAAGLSGRIQALATALRESNVPGLEEAVPGRRSLYLEYDPLRLSCALLKAAVREKAAGATTGSPAGVGREVVIPVVYGGEFGPDLPAVAAHAGLSPEEVVRLHAGATYLVRFLGFLPGFPYLGGLPPRLATPRKDTPALRVPAGSVAIGGDQAGIYPLASPGGWWVIGRTPLPLCRFDGDPPALLRAGDRVIFRPVEAAGSAVVAAGIPPAALRPSSGADTLRVLDAGFLTTVQDAGRRGFAASGIVRAGAVDEDALFLGNTMLGNPQGAAALEYAYRGPVLEAIRPCRALLSGAAAGARLDGRPVEAWRALDLKASSVLETGSVAGGNWGYVCLEGGVRVPPVLGSLSTDLGVGVGGYEGRALRVGDRLPAGRVRTIVPTGNLPSALRPSYGKETVLRVLPGPHRERFPSGTVAAFFGGSYRVTRLDRRGARLEGPRLIAASHDLASEGTPPGGIQVPGDGQPIILGADRPTTGGYPEIAVVIRADLGRAGQLSPGGTVRFAEVTEEEAVDVLRERERSRFLFAARHGPMVD